MTTGPDSGRAMILSPGESFGAYTILGPLGRGGMGEVYRARDNRLGRDVALKILPDEGADDPERIRRFEQEARAASALNHPNIVVIYETGEATPAGRDRPVRFLAMELLEGEPLNAILMGGALPIRRTLDYACQIADGLSRAHESGIVHRDLKPSNIVVTRDGHLKILDFGLAKLRPFSAEDKTLEVTTDPTLTSPGTLLGTVGYMAPEQVRSEPATPASDQFGFGCILFEMLTGRRPFQRASPAETLSAILRDEPPPIEALNPKVPAPLRWIVERCLSKTPRDRYASTRDMARDLLKLKEASTEAGFRSSISVALNAPRQRRALRLAGAALLLFLLAAGGSFLLWQKLRTFPPPTFQRLTFRHGVVWRALFAPSAGSILFTASWDGQPTRTYMTLPETAGLDRLLEAEPLVPMAFSPDGSEVLVLLEAFRVPHLLISGTLARMPALGGKPRRILDQAGWADWSRSGKLLAVVRHANGERILELRDADGTQPRELFRTRGAISFVRFSPDDRSIAFAHHPEVTQSGGEVRIVGLDGKSARAVTPEIDSCWGLDWNARTGEIWFTGTQGHRSFLWAVTAAGRRREVYTFPEQLVLQSIQPASNRCLLTSEQQRGVLIVRSAGGPARDLSWLSYTRVTDLSPDRKRLLFVEEGPTPRTSGAYVRSIDGGDAVKLSDWLPGRFSPDGNWVVGLTNELPRQLALFPVEAGASRLLATPGMEASDPSFLDADTILFVGTASGARRVWRIRTDGSGLSPVGAPDCDFPQPNPGRNALVCEGGPGNRAIFLYPMDGGPGRKLHELSGARRFWYARFNARGDQIFAVASDREFFTFDAQTGRVVAQEILPTPQQEGYSELIDAIFDADAATQAYSLNVYASHLYLASGLR
jgi:hypothetical protein